MGTPQMIAMRPNIMKITQAHRESAVKTSVVDTGDIHTTVVEKLMEVGGRVELTDADIIVVGGMFQILPSFIEKANKMRQ